MSAPNPALRREVIAIYKAHVVQSSLYLSDTKQNSSTWAETIPKAIPGSGRDCTVPSWRAPTFATKRRYGKALLEPSL
ncbi:uncharacterized protein PG986_004343 [Apiospora aurea]|uniref:Uncharacterized protein n=1 Tax=Apiospora aurea TaxID=335848 RepID=A0ABR1QMB4_9PEZI